MFVSPNKRICFNVISFVKCLNIRNEHIAQFIGTMHCRVSQLSYTSNTKTTLA